jgi:hypothetical protein
MAAISREACVAKQKLLWSSVVHKDKYICSDCSKNTSRNKYMSLPLAYFAVCILDDNRTSGQYYLVSNKDLYDQHRAVDGNTTKNLNPVRISSLINKR